MSVFEEFLPVSGRLSGLLYVVPTLGFKAIPWAAGQCLEASPKSLFAFSSAGAAACLAMFEPVVGCAGKVRGRLKKEGKMLGSEEEEEEVKLCRRNYY